ncbi:MAG: TetR/AcrR family transcriptional regulator [Acidobacteriota bacterium]
MKKSTADRILDAVVQLYIENGREGVSIRPITKMAGCSNVTIFNIFKNKDGLIEEALRRELSGLDTTIPARPSDSVERDLETLARRYFDFYWDNPFIMMVFPEIMRRRRLQEILKEEQARTIAALVWFYGHHRDRKSWRDDVQVLPLERINEEISLPFLGGIYLHVQFAKSDLANPAFDEKLYVRRFLGGWGSRANQADSASSEESVSDDS